jgi:hypothetical protein
VGLDTKTERLTDRQLQCDFDLTNSEPAGDKNRITSMALKRAGYAGLGKGRGDVVRVLWAENRGCDWVLGTPWRMQAQT